jgi:hypothetical protein
MNEEQTGQELPIPDRIPQRINEGMLVYDREGEVVGTVKVIYFGGASEEAIQRVLHPEEAPAAGEGESNWSPFDADNVPKELRARLMQQGYILVEGPDLTGVKRYIGPEQIEGVFPQEVEGSMNDAVRLLITRAELLNT